MTTPILSPKILLIQNDRAAAKEIRAALAAAGSGSFDMEWVRQLSEGIERLSKKGIAAVCSSRRAICPITSNGYSRNCRPLRGRTSLRP
jgi:hypothetical protein